MPDQGRENGHKQPAVRVASAAGKPPIIPGAAEGSERLAEKVREREIRQRAKLYFGFLWGASW